MFARMFIFPGVTTGQFIFILIIFLLVFIGIVVSMTAYFYKERILTNKQLFETYFNKYALSVLQREILQNLSQKYPNLDVNRFFRERHFYEYMVKHYLNALKWDGLDQKQIAGTVKELEEVKKKLNFSTHKIFSTRDIPEGDSVKAKIGDIGVFSLKVMSNENDGLLLKFPYIEKVKEEEKIDRIILYYWSDQRDYKVKTKLKKILREEENFILVAHSKAEIQGIDPSGAKIQTEAVPVYFEHIFDLTPKELREIKSHIFRGAIVAFSKIGLEVVTKERIVYKDTDFKFEFRDGQNRYHFTGSLSDVHKASDGTHFFVTYKSINERTRKYINLISKKEIS